MEYKWTIDGVGTEWSENNEIYVIEIDSLPLYHEKDIILEVRNFLGEEASTTSQILAQYQNIPLVISSRGTLIYTK